MAEFSKGMIVGAVIAKAVDIKHGTGAKVVYGFVAYYKPPLVEKREVASQIERDAFDAFLLAKA